MADKIYRLLVINPGSTSTKVALFENDEIRAEKNLLHSGTEMSDFTTILEQLPVRRQAVEFFLQEQKLHTTDLDAVVGRGGLFRAIAGGTYVVNERMMTDARAGRQGQHSSNLGCLLANAIATVAGIPAFVVDPVSVDEFEPLARYSGHPSLERRCLSHALNLHMVARWAAKKLGISLANSQFVVAHLGGGISIAPLKGGRIIDVNDATSAGPFSPERAGGLPLQGFIDLCFSGQYSKAEIKKMVMGEGGLKAYLGTADARVIENRIQQGDTKAAEVMAAMAYQIAKEIGAMATVLCGKVDAIVLTGGLANDERLVNWVSERVRFIAPIEIIAGEFEMVAMAQGGLRVLRGEEQAKEY